MRASRLLIATLLFACGRPMEAPPRADAMALPPSRTFLVEHARALDGTPLALAVSEGELVTPEALPADAPRLDAQGAFVVPAFVDAHVHLSYDPVALEHARGGVAVAIDLASPIEALGTAAAPLTVLRAGPMITSVGGYPLDSWGSAGYGVECTDAIGCAARVDELVAHGADLVKVPIEAGGLDDTALAAIVTRAHAAERLVVAHALSEDAAARAARVGVDVLAHTPVAPLDALTLEALRGRAVVSTLAAFGGSEAAVENLRALRAHGVEVLYGTDLGNTRTTGIDPRELALLVQAGLDASAIVASATATPARVFGLARHGSLEPGHAASFLLYRADPTLDPTLLARPDLVVLDGARP